MNKLYYSLLSLTLMSASAIYAMAPDLRSIMQNRTKSITEVDNQSSDVVMVTAFIKPDKSPAQRPTLPSQSPAEVQAAKAKQFGEPDIMILIEAGKTWTGKENLMSKYEQNVVITTAAGDKTYSSNNPKFTGNTKITVDQNGTVTFS